MTAAEIVAACYANGVILQSVGDGRLHYRPTPPRALLDALREQKADVLALLGSKTPEVFDWYLPDVEALRQASKVPLPNDLEPRLVLRPLTEDEKHQLRTTGKPMPNGVSFGQTTTGQWRRLT